MKPMWKLADSPRSWARDHSGYQCESRRAGRPTFSGALENRKPRCARAAQRHISCSDASKSQNGRAMLGMNLFGSYEEKTVRKTLYAFPQATTDRATLQRSLNTCL